MKALNVRKFSWTGIVRTHITVKKIEVKMVSTFEATKQAKRRKEKLACICLKRCSVYMNIIDVAYTLWEIFLNLGYVRVCTMFHWLRFFDFYGLLFVLMCIRLYSVSILVLAVLTHVTAVEFLSHQHPVYLHPSSSIVYA